MAPKQKDLVKEKVEAWLEAICTLKKCELLESASELKTATDSKKNTSEFIVKDEKRTPNPSSPGSFNSVEKPKQVLFELGSKFPVSLEKLKEKLWPVWKRRNAVDMELYYKGTNVSVIVNFNHVDEAEYAKSTSSLRRMRELLETVQTRTRKTERNSQISNNKYFGPNGQKQKQNFYKQHFCSFGCDEFVEQEDMEKHRQQCRAYLKYEEDKGNYERCTLRKTEQPSACIAHYEEDALDGKNRESAHGYLYGMGPYLLKGKVIPEK